MKIKSCKKIVSAMLSAAILAGSLAGCAGAGDGTNSTGGTGTGSTAGGATTATGGKLDFKITTVGFGTDPTGKLIQTTWLDQVGKAMGVTLNPSYEYIHSEDYEQKIKIICAGGDIPDLLTYWKDTQPNLIKFGEQGLFEELTQHMDKLPNYKKILDIDTTSKRNLYSQSGKLYGFYNARYQPDGDNSINNATAFRMDILDEVGLPVPQTTEEVYQAALAMKKKYPDKYPIILHEEWQMPDNMFYATNHTAKDRYYDGTEYKFGPMDDSYKDALIEMNRWYKDALISPDYFTHTSENGAATVASGDAMIVPSIWDGYPGNWKKEYPDQKWVLAPYIKNEKYGEPWMLWKGSPDEWKLNSSYCVLIGAKSKLKDQMLQLMDLQYSEDIVNLLTWGIEGETYEVVDGNKKMTQKYIDDTALFTEIALGSGTCRPAIFPQPQNVTQMASTSPIMDIFFKGKVTTERTFDFIKTNFDDKYVAPGSKVVLDAITTEEGQQYSNIMTAVKTFTDEQRVKFIKGERSFDEWPKYLEEIQKMGDVQAAMDIYNGKIVK